MQRGFTLVEVLVATTLLTVAALGGMQLIAFATRMMSAARIASITAGLASGRMEQLRSLRFEYDASGARVRDLSTNLATEPAGGGGPGLTPAGAASLDASVNGYADFLDRNGIWIAAGSAPPPGTAFVRRWSIDADPGGDLLVLQVLVRPVASGIASGSQRVAGEARFVTLRARERR